MSEKSKQPLFVDNPEKAMIVLFPLITLALFIVAAILWWAIQNFLVS